MRPRRLPSLLLSLLLLAVVAGCGAPGVSFGPPLVTVATEDGFVPFAFRDPVRKELIGFDIDLMRALAARAGFEVSFRRLPFEEVLESVGQGRFELGLAGITITDERREALEFSEPYFQAGLVVAVRRKEQRISSLGDLSGKRVGTRLGTTSALYLSRNHQDSRIQVYPEIEEAYRALRSGRLDAVLYDLPNVRYYIRTQALGLLRTTGDVLRAEEYGIVFRPGSPLRERVDRALAAMRADGSLEALKQHWFGVAGQDGPAPPPESSGGHH